MSVRVVPFSPRDPYRDVVAEMRRCADEVRRGAPDMLLMGAHADLITVGRNRGAEDIHDARPSRIALFQTDRGGAATAHGPGQAVVYPVVHLRRAGVGVRVFVQRLERVMCEVALSYGVVAETQHGAPGVFRASDGAKLGSIGLRVDAGVTRHGIALNVLGVPEGFAFIAACGDAATRMGALASDKKPERMEGLETAEGLERPTLRGVLERLKTALQRNAVVPLATAAANR